MTPDRSTRARLLTPPGAGAIGIVRLSGAQAEAITQAVFRAAGPANTELKLNHLYYGTFIADGSVIDDVVCSKITRHGEIAIDICAHGGVRVIERILSALASQGAEVFTAASQNDPCGPVDDMIQYEASVALSSVRTERGVRFLARQYAKLPGVISEIADTAETDANAARDRLSALIALADGAYRLVTGATVALVGPTNAGKSTLFNRLVGRHAVVVSSTSGTTRDWVREPIEIDGLAVDLIDTAGLHASADALETAAIAGGHRQIASADLRVIVLDGSVAPDSGLLQTIQKWKALGPYLVVRNKSDLPPSDLAPSDPARSNLTRTEDAAAYPCNPQVAVAVSALTGSGLDRLGAAIVERLGITPDLEAKPALFHPRQLEAAMRATAMLRNEPEIGKKPLQQELLGSFYREDR